MDLTNDDAFDRYAAERGWRYDNSGSHRGQTWDWYFHAGSDPDLVLLRQSPGRVALVRIEGLVVNEVWAGHVADPVQFDALMSVFAQLARRG